jgi:hypothetical protein
MRHNLVRGGSELPKTWLKDFLRETKIHTWEQGVYFRGGSHDGFNMRGWAGSAIFQCC